MEIKLGQIYESKNEEMPWCNWYCNIHKINKNGSVYIILAQSLTGQKHTKSISVESLKNFLKKENYKLISESN